MTKLPVLTRSADGRIWVAADEGVADLVTPEPVPLKLRQLSWSTWRSTAAISASGTGAGSPSKLTRFTAPGIQCRVEGLISARST